MFISHQAPVNRDYFKTGDKIEFLSNTGKTTSATAMNDSGELIPFIFDQILFLDNAMEFFGGNLKTITITLGDSRSRNHRRTNGGAR